MEREQLKSSENQNIIMIQQKNKPVLYLAGPCGFSEIGRVGLEPIEAKLSEKYDVINPFTRSASDGQIISDLEKMLHNPKSTQNGLSAAEIHEELFKISMKLGKSNVELIKSADRVFAILDGSDVDSGTAAEIGFAFAIGKRVDGYRGDFRYSRDNFGAQINLQVEYFIRASGGTIFRNINEITF